MSYLPKVAEGLKKVICLLEFKLLLKLIAAGKYPTKNIAFRLMLETARWFSNQSTTQMYITGTIHYHFGKRG